MPQCNQCGKPAIVEYHTHPLCVEHYRMMMQIEHSHLSWLAANLNRVQGELEAEAGGFVRHSYKGGLDPTEFFFNAITGRDTIMDTSMRTPKSGYLQRRLVNALQDLKVGYDSTVRDASGRIVQFIYGADGIDVSKSDYGKLLIPKGEIK